MIPSPGKDPCRTIATAAIALLSAVSATVLQAAPGATAAPQSAGFFEQTNLVSDEPGVALIQDPDLVNPWGIALSPTTGAFWVANNGTGISTLYTGDVGGSPLVKAGFTVAIPGGSPTGNVFNPTTEFVVSAGADSGPALFLFVSLGGQVTGWNPVVPLPPPSTTAQFAAQADATYTGMAIGQTSAGTNVIYAADFENGTIDVFDGDFSSTELDGSFTDPDLGKGLSPFNIQNIGGKLYVTYARTSARNPGEETGHGPGAVNVFDTDGHLLQRLIGRGGRLVAPWGMTLAPSGFGPFGNDLLVGDFATGRILAFDPDSGDFLGFLRGEDGKPIAIEGLWGIVFGNGVTAGDADTLYFAAGPDDETHGLFGSLRFAGD